MSYCRHCRIEFTRPKGTTTRYCSDECRAIVHKERNDARPSWRVIPEHPDYEISTEGDVRNRKTGKCRAVQICGQTATLKLNGKNHSLPRLILTVFSPVEHATKYYAAYKDGNPKNNRLSNLEWRYIGLHQSHLTLQDIQDIQARWQATEESYRAIGKDYNLGPNSIGAIIRGEYWGIVS